MLKEYFEFSAQELISLMIKMIDLLERNKDNKATQMQVEQLA